jgi:uncharacterized heparinase superfamily protein
MTGPFMWEQHARAQLEIWEPSEAGGRLVASHDGYKRLDDPVIHTREIVLQADKHLLMVKDRLNCTGNHSVKLHFHLSEYAEVTAQDSRKLTVSMDNGTNVSFEFGGDVSVELLRGDPQGHDEPGPGWLSRGYHRKQPNTCIVVTGAISGTTTLETRISWR